MAIDVSTKQSVAVIDITDRVTDRLPADHSGACTVFVPHTTAGITINEAESGLLADLERALERLVPEGEGYEHNAIDNNATAHLRSMLLGAEVTVPVADGRPDLGRWQSILFVESDGPRTRQVSVRPIPTR